MERQAKRSICWPAARDPPLALRNNISGPGKGRARACAAASSPSSLVMRCACSLPANCSQSIECRTKSISHRPHPRVCRRELALELGYTTSTLLASESLAA